MSGRYDIFVDQLNLTPGSKVIKASEYERYLAADEVITEAIETAKRIEEDAKVAYQAEKERGYEEGFAQAQQEVAQKLMECTSEYAESVISLQESLVAILPTLVKKVVGSFNDGDLIIKLVKQTISSLSVEKVLKLLVNPKLVTEIEQRKDQILESHPMIEYIEVVADSSVDERSCEVQSEILTATVNADSLLEKVEQVINMYLEGE